MINAIDIENVRVFEGSDWKFNLPQLSVFCGTNSSGKSTLLKLLLMLHQTTSVKESILGSVGKLRLSGSQVDMGTYRSLVSGNDLSRNIAITIHAEGTMSSGSYIAARKALVGASTKDDPAMSAKKTQGPINYTVRAKFVFCANSPAPSLDQDSDQKDGLLEASFSLVKDDVVFMNWKLRPTKKGIKGKQKSETITAYVIVLPKSYFEQIGGYDVMDISRPPDSEENIELDATMTGILPLLIYAPVKQKDREQREAGTAGNREYKFVPLPPIIESANRALRQALQVDYVAPLRTPAKRYSIANVGAQPDMDAAGECLPILLKNRKFRDQKVLNVRIGQQTSRVESLTDAINYWLHYLRTGEPTNKTRCRELEIATTKDILVEFKVRSVNGKGLHAIADSGFGYSQVLPILIRGLLMRNHGTLIIEQPELHLNPALQVRLAEFLLSLAHAKKQIIIETHSEHIVNAFRVYAVENPAFQLSANCAIYFLATQGSSPTVHSLNIKDDGSVPNWPKQFFGEALSLSGRLLRAQQRSVPTPSTGQ
jgi:predicted ATPase